jgi:hypothetical protein
MGAIGELEIARPIVKADLARRWRILRLLRLFYRRI